MKSDPNRPLNILLVDDIGANLVALEAVLASPEFTLLQARSGPEALEAIRQHDFALILLDIQMPGMDGFETARQIRSCPQGKEVPIVFVTALDRDPKHLEQGFKMGAVDYVYKPYEPLALRAKVNMFVELYRKNRELIESQEQLRISELRFRLLVQGVHDYAIFMLDPLGNVTSWNEGARKNHGYEAAEILGRHFSIFYPKEVAASGHPQHELQIASQRGRYEEEGWRVRKNGSCFWANVLITAIRDESGNLFGFSKVVRDLTERRHAEEARIEEQRKAAISEQVRENERVLDQIFSEAPSFMALVDVPGLRFLKSNAQYLRLVGSDVVGRPAREIGLALREQDLGELLDQVARTGRPYVGKEVPTRLAGPHANTERRAFLDVVFQPLRRSDGDIYAVAIQGYDVTDQVQARERVRLSETRLRSSLAETRALLNASPAFFGFVDPATHALTICNDLALRAIAKPSQEVYGRVFYDCPWWKSLPDSAARVRTALELAVQGQTTEFDIEYWSAGGSPEGEVRWLTFRAAPVHNDAGELDKISVSGVEITEQKREAQRTAFLAEASKLLATSLDYHDTLGDLARLSVPAIADWCTVTIVREDQTKVRVAAVHRDPEKSKVIEELAREYPISEDKESGIGWVIEHGKPIYTPSVDDDSLVAAARDQRHLKLMRDLGCRSGIVAPIVARGKVLGAVALMLGQSKRTYDASDLFMAEELGRRAGVAVDNASLYETAQKAIQTRDEFMSIASHELKTPITSLQLHLEMTRRATHPEAGVAPSPAKLAKTLDVSTSQVHRLTALVDDLLDVTRIQGGKLSFNFECVDASALVREVVERYTDPLRVAGCTLSFSALGPAFLWADRFRLEQVVVNLLTNAAKYGAGKPVEVQVKSLEDRHVQIICQDHGMGIPKDKQATVFDRFVRAVDSSPIKGLGLGLYISREIVRAHHGTISVESEPGQGARFVVDLPVNLPN